MKQKILIVEDEEMLAKVLVEQFKKAGFDIEAVFDGEQALESLKKSAPDLVLLDIILPKKDGFEVLKAIKENPDTQDIPVIMISNLGSDEDIKQSIKLGAADYYVKAQHPIYEITEKVSKFLSIPKSPLGKSKAPAMSAGPLRRSFSEASRQATEKKTAVSLEAPEEKPVKKIMEKPAGKIIEKPAEKIIEKPKAVEKPAEKIIEKAAAKVVEKAVEKAVPPAGEGTLSVPGEKKTKEEYPQLSKGARKFIRTKKAELREINLPPKEYEAQIAKIYQTFSKKS